MKIGWSSVFKLPLREAFDSKFNVEKQKKRYEGYSYNPDQDLLFYILPYYDELLKESLS